MVDVLNLVPGETDGVTKAAAELLNVANEHSAVSDTGLPAVVGLALFAMFAVAANHPAFDEATIGSAVAGAVANAFPNLRPDQRDTFCRRLRQELDVQISSVRRLRTANDG